MDEGTGTSVSDSSGNSKNGTITHITSGGAWNAFNGRYSGPFYPKIVQPGASYNFNNGDYLTVASSNSDSSFDLTRNYSLIAWVKCGPYNINPPTGTQQIIGRGSGNNYWALNVRGTDLHAGFTYSNGSASSNIYGTSVCTGDWNMFGITLDNSSIPVAKFIINGKLLAPSGSGSIAYAPTNASGQYVTLGADAAGGSKFIGNMDDVQIYNTPLTDLQVQQLYEDRILASTEANTPTVPGVTSSTGVKLIYQDTNYCVSNQVPLQISTDGVTVNNCTVYGAGIQANANATIKNTIGWNASGDDITIASGKTVTGSYNLFGDSAKAGAGTYSDIGNTTGWNIAPLFTNATGSNFSLQPTSPAIDAGVDLDITTDYASNHPYDDPSVANTGSVGSYTKNYVDIGAYEYVTPPDPTPASTSFPSQSTWYNTKNPTTISFSSPYDVLANAATTDFRYTIDQTQTPTTNQVKAGTLLEGAVTFDAQSSITSTGTWYIHTIAENKNDPTIFSTNFNTYTINYDSTAPTTPTISTIATNSTTQLTITSTTATDTESGLSATPYQFQETTGNAGSSSSDWQSGTTFIDSGLSPCTNYRYKVRSKDAAGNISDYSSFVEGMTAGCISGGNSYTAPTTQTALPTQQPTVTPPTEQPPTQTPTTTPQINTMTPQQRTTLIVQIKQQLIVLIIQLIQLLTQQAGQMGR